MVGEMLSRVVTIGINRNGVHACAMQDARADGGATREEDEGPNIRTVFWDCRWRFWKMMHSCTCVFFMGGCNTLDSSRPFRPRKHFESQTVFRQPCIDFSLSARDIILNRMSYHVNV